MNIHTLRTIIINAITLSVAIGLRQNRRRNHEISPEPWLLGASGNNLPKAIVVALALALFGLVPLVAFTHQDPANAARLMGLDWYRLRSWVTAALYRIGSAPRYTPSWRSDL